MTRDEAIKILKNPNEEYHGSDGTSGYTFNPNGKNYEAFQLAIKALEQEPCEDCISRVDALRVAKNEYLRGWHNALCKALSEKYSIHCEEGNFSVIQEETITGLGLSMDCAVGKDVESYISTIPRVTPQEPILDKIRTEIEGKYRVILKGTPKDDWAVIWNECIDDVLKIIDKHKVESEGE